MIRDKDRNGVIDETEQGEKARVKRHSLMENKVEQKNYVIQNVH